MFFMGSKEVDIHIHNFYTTWWCDVHFHLEITSAKHYDMDYNMGASANTFFLDRKALAR
jgi:hypothetical protein